MNTMQIEVVAVNKYGHEARPGEVTNPHQVAVKVEGKRVGSVLNADYGRAVCSCCGRTGLMFEPYSKGRMFGHHSTRAGGIEALVKGTQALVDARVAELEKAR